MEVMITLSGPFILSHSHSSCGYQKVTNPMKDNMLIKPVIKPTNRDVINGRGKGLQKVPGNIKYRKLCEANKASSILA
jgi:hypothetical protein